MWSSSLCGCCTAVLRLKAFKLLEREIRPDTHASMFTRLYSVWLLFMGCQKDFVFRESSTTIEELRHKMRQGSQTVENNTLNKFYKSMENRLRFVLREVGAHFEHLFNWKSFTSNMSILHQWATKISKSLKNVAFNFRHF